MVPYLSQYVRLDDQEPSSGSGWKVWENFLYLQNQPVNSIVNSVSRFLLKKWFLDKALFPEEILSKILFLIQFFDFTL